MLSVLIDDYRAGRKPARADIFNSGGEQLLQLAQADVLEKIDWKKYMPDLTSEEITMGGASLAVGLSPMHSCTIQRSSKTLPGAWKI